MKNQELIPGELYKIHEYESYPDGSKFEVKFFCLYIRGTDKRFVSKSSGSVITMYVGRADGFLRFLYENQIYYLFDETNEKRDSNSFKYVFEFKKIS